MSDGRPVTHYGDLIEYLLGLARDQGGNSSRSSSVIQAVRLDFEGKNILLYSLGSSGHYEGEFEAPPDTPQRHVVRGPALSEHWWELSANNKVLH